MKRPRLAHQGLLPSPAGPSVAIACGGTGGHLFPGIAVGAELLSHGVHVQLIVSEKDVDQLALRGETRFEITRLPSVGISQRGWYALVAGFCRSWRQCRTGFASIRPAAVLSMGGFTGAAPLIAGRRCGARLFLHDSNAIPGRANRWLSSWVDESFVAFEEAAVLLRSPRVTMTGTPVREGFTRPPSPAPARVALGLHPLRPVLLVMGGSQGARGVNDAVVDCLEHLGREAGELQYLHLTGPADLEAVQRAYRRLGLAASVHSFLPNMDEVMAAATLAVSRAGGSSLAELAAMRLPAILIPYPAAADDHQTSNAMAYARSGAALCVPQPEAASGKLSQPVLRLLREPLCAERMRQALAKWHFPEAARRIAEPILKSMGKTLDPQGHLPSSTLLMG